MSSSAVALLTPAQTQLLRGSCSFDADSCGYTSDPAHAAWTINEEGMRRVQARFECRLLVFQLFSFCSKSGHQRPQLVEVSNLKGQFIQK